jgi:hypothetical protein
MIADLAPAQLVIADHEIVNSGVREIVRLGRFSVYEVIEP